MGVNHFPCGDCYLEIFPPFFLLFASGTIFRSICTPDSWEEELINLNSITDKTPLHFVEYYRGGKPFHGNFNGSKMAPFSEN